jgi:hypothetical protein
MEARYAAGDWVGTASSASVRPSRTTRAIAEAIRRYGIVFFM